MEKVIEKNLKVEFHLTHTFNVKCKTRWWNMQSASRINNCEPGNKSRTNHVIMWPMMLAQVPTCYSINFSFYNNFNLIEFPMTKATQNSISSIS